MRRDLFNMVAAPCPAGDMRISVLSSVDVSMAEDAVDTAVKTGKLAPANGCLTENLPLVGAEGWDPASFTVLAQQFVRMKRSYGGKIVPGAMDTAAAKHLVHSYGGLAPRVALIGQVRVPWSGTVPNICLILF